MTSVNYYDVERFVEDNIGYTGKTRITLSPSNEDVIHESKENQICM